MYEYKCNLVKVVDGDTIDVDIDLGFGVWMKNQRIRMYGIDTPESRTSDDVEKVYGNAAKDFLINWTKSGDLTLKTFKDGKGKYGRILGEIWYAGDHNDTILRLPEQLFSDEKVAENEVMDKAKELENIITKIEAKEERWFELSAKIEG